MRLGSTVVEHLLLPLMTSFNKTAAATFPMQTTLPEDSLFLRLNYLKSLTLSNVKSQYGKRPYIF